MSDFWEFLSISDNILLMLNLFFSDSFLVNIKFHMFHRNFIFLLNVSTWILPVSFEEWGDSHDTPGTAQSDGGQVSVTCNKCAEQSCNVEECGGNYW